MSMTEWAEDEVRIAIENEKPEEREYVKSCAESALKAYKSLMEDGHSGGSWSVTRYILIKLLNEENLTPINEDDDVWECVEGSDKETDVYQCRRRSSLFKSVNRTTGEVKYHDTERVVGLDIDDPKCGYYHSNLLYDIMTEYYPIKFPYSPSRPIKVITSDLLYDKKNGGDLDTIWVKDAILPNGTAMTLNRYFRSPKNAVEKCRYKNWVEIDKKEFMERFEASEGFSE